jgi:hypothetical protein
MAAPKTSTSALQSAIKGETVTDRQARSALGAAVDKIANLSRRAERSKDAMLATGKDVVHTAETHGSLFLASMAEGYLGGEKLKLGGVDVRAPVGLVAAGWGLYETMSGGKGGGHALALGNGVLGSWLASMAVSAGRTLADKRQGNSFTAPPLLTPSSLQGMLPAPDGLEGMDLDGIQLEGPMREVLLTPEADHIEGPRGRWRPPKRRRKAMRQRVRKRVRQRFLRGQRDEDEDDIDPDDLDMMLDEETD